MIAIVNWSLANTLAICLGGVESMGADSEMVYNLYIPGDSYVVPFWVVDYNS